MIGLCAKAGKIFFGAQACENGIKKNKIQLIILENTVSQNTKKVFFDACKYYNVPIILNKSTRTIGEAAGKPANKVFGIVCPRFSKRLMELYEGKISGGVKV